MRVKVAVGLLCLLLAPWLSTQGWLGWERWRLRQYVRAQIMAGLPDTALVCLRFSVAEAQGQLRWERTDEFVLHGQWYDVVRQEQQGDSLLLWCLLDSAETALEAAQQKQLAQLWAHHPAAHQAAQRLWAFFFALFWANPAAVWPTTHPPAQKAPTVWNSSLCAQRHCSPPAPPPEGRPRHEALTF